jgi:hypothetical protein
MTVSSRRVFHETARAPFREGKPLPAVSACKFRVAIQHFSIPQIFCRY